LFVSSKQAQQQEMFDDDELTIGTTTVGSNREDDAFPLRGSRHHSPLTDTDDDDANGGRRPPAAESHEPAAAATTDEATGTDEDIPHVLTNNKSPTTTAPTQSSAGQQHQQQQPRISKQEAAAIGETIMRALSGEDILENFLRKYPRPTPGSGVGVGPIKSTTQGSDRKGRPRAPDYHVKRAEKLREKRRRLRELQEREFQLAMTPPRRANSAAVGLLSFGMTFILFGLHYTGHFVLDTVVPAMAICFGGGVQLIAGLLAWTQGLTFAYVSFVSCGCFFLAIACIWMLPNASFSMGSLVQPPSDYFTGAFYSVWGVYSAILLICTPRMNLCILLKVLTTTVCLLCLAGGLMADNTTAVHVGGYFGIITGAVSLYLCFASLINEVWDGNIIPVFQTTNVLEGAPLFGKKTAKDEGGSAVKSATNADDVDDEVEENNLAERVQSESLSVLPAV
jgi:uncharacterized protein